MTTYTDKQIRDAAIMKTNLEHPDWSDAQIAEVVDRVLGTMTRDEAIAAYITGDQPAIVSGPAILPFRGGFSNTPAASAVPAPPTPEQKQSKFQAALTSAGLPGDGLTKQLFTQMLEQSGVDTSLPGVQTIISTIPFYSAPTDSDQQKQLDIAQAQALLQTIVADPRYAPPKTPYSQALEASGFGTDFTFPAGYAGAQRGPGIQTTLPPTPNYVSQSETGWILYKNGVLVDPSSQSVIFKPNSMAPGSPAWLQSVKNWSPEQVASWRKRLVEMGYLSKDQENIKGIDQVFLNALNGSIPGSYHYNRYLNNGKPIPGDLSLTQVQPGFTAKDFQQQIQNDVRTQFKASFGSDPTDAELQSWTRFVMQKMTDLQHQFIRRGIDPGSAASQALNQAEEAMTGRVGGSPQAEMLAAQENTTLRDGLEQAALVTRSLVS